MFQKHLLSDPLFSKDLFIYLATPGLSCGMSLGKPTRLSLGRLQWEHGVLATGPPGKSSDH